MRIASSKRPERNQIQLQQATGQSSYNTDCDIILSPSQLRDLQTMAVPRRSQSKKRANQNDFLRNVFKTKDSHVPEVADTLQMHRNGVLNSVESKNLFDLHRKTVGNKRIKDSRGSNGRSSSLNQTSQLQTTQAPITHAYNTGSVAFGQRMKGQTKRMKQE